MRQAEFVALQVLEQRENGIDLKRQAVLFRTSSHSAPLELELARRNIPFVKFGGLKFQNAAHVTNLTARTQAGSAWGLGPYSIRRDATIPATLEPLLTAIGATQHKHFQFTDAPLPTSACGCVELVIP